LQTSPSSLTRAILTEPGRITLLSGHESRAEEEMGFLTVLKFAVPHAARQVQVTTRADWLPTAVQARVLQGLHDRARGPEGAGLITRGKKPETGGGRLRPRRHTLAVNRPMTGKDADRPSRKAN